MAEEEKIIYSITYDTAQAQKDLEALVQEQVKAREEQKALTTQFKNGEISIEQYGKELAASQQQLKRNSKELQDTKKILDTTSGSLGAQRLRLSQLKKEWVDQEKVTKEGRKRFNELGKEIKALNDDIKEQEENVGIFTRSVGAYTDGILQAAGQTNVFGINLGKAAGAFVAVDKGIKASTGSLKLFKIALASTGIGLLLVAIGSLITFFSKSQKGIDLWNQVMAGASAIVGVVTDRVARLGGILVDVFTGKTGIVEGARQAADAMSGIGDELEREIGLAVELEKKAQDLRRSRLGFIQTEAVIQAQIEKTRLAAEDASRSEEERVKSAQAGQKLINSLFDARKRNLQEELDILKQQIALTDESTTIEDLEKQSQLQTDIFLLEKDRASQLKEVRNQENALNKIVDARLESEREKQEAINKAGIAAALERKSIRETEAEEQEKQEQEAIKRIVRIGNAGVKAALDEAKEKKAASDQAKAAQQADEQAVYNSKVFFAESAANLVQGVLREETIAHKIFASARAAANVWEAVTAALAIKAPPPIPQLFAGAYLAQGLAAIAQINGIKFAEGGIIPEGAGIVQGRSHAQGGVKSGGAELEGGEVILGRRVSESPYLLGLASRISQAAGYPPFAPRTHLQDGGFAIRAVNQTVSDQENLQSVVRQTIASMPPIWVAVRDIRKEVGNSERTENRARIG